MYGGLLLLYPLVARMAFGEAPNVPAGDPPAVGTGGRAGDVSGWTISYIAGAGLEAGDDSMVGDGSTFAAASASAAGAVGILGTEVAAERATTTLAGVFGCSKKLLHALKNAKPATSTAPSKIVASTIMCLRDIRRITDTSKAKSKLVNNHIIFHQLQVRSFRLVSLAYHLRLLERCGPIEPWGRMDAWATSYAS
jgi:hypothetical protein